MLHKAQWPDMLDEHMRDVIHAEEGLGGERD